MSNVSMKFCDGGISVLELPPKCGLTLHESDLSVVINALVAMAWYTCSKDPFAGIAKE